MTEVNTGTVLAGKYRLESLIGEGGMGSVWRAEHLGLSAPVAVKLLHRGALAGNPESLSRFHREARAAAAIRSPHVVQILDHGVDEAIGAPFIVMELMEGESLAQRLARFGRVEPAEAARIFTHVARALSRAHDSGIVHRDLKPDNVFLVRNEDEEVAKVLDFGIAKAQAHGLDAASATRTGAVMGTAYYMSPEQISGTKNVDFRTDLWAFGVMACECLTGVRPFDADTIGGLTLRICVEPIPLPSNLAAVPPGFDAWFARCVNRDPAQRFPSAREAAEALRQVCAGAAPLRFASAQPRSDNAARVPLTPTDGSLSVSSSGPGSAEARRSKSGPALALGAVAIVALAGAAWLYRASQSREASDARADVSGSLASVTKPGLAAVAPVVVTPMASAPDAPLPSPAVASAKPASGIATAAPQRPHAANPPAQPAKAPAPKPIAPAVTPPAKSAPRDIIEDRH